MGFGSFDSDVDARYEGLAYVRQAGQSRSGAWDLGLSQYNSFMGGQFVKKDKPDSGNVGPSRVLTYNERIVRVFVEEFELPSCYGTRTGTGFVARNVSGDESSDSSDDDEITHGLSHHEKRLLRFEARLKQVEQAQS